MTNPILDTGFFLSMIIIGFACMTLYQKIGALMLVGSILAFLFSGLFILTGYDVASFTQTATSSGLINQTSYFIGNGQFPPPSLGMGEIWMGFTMIVLACVVGVIFLDQTLKGNLIKGD